MWEHVKTSFLNCETILQKKRALKTKSKTFEQKMDLSADWLGTILQILYSVSLTFGKRNNQNLFLLCCIIWILRISHIKKYIVERFKNRFGSDFYQFHLTCVQIRGSFLILSGGWTSGAVYTYTRSMELVGEYLGNVMASAASECLLRWILNLFSAFNSNSNSLESLNWL